jgi:hypothetical protein
MSMTAAKFFALLNEMIEKRSFDESLSRPILERLRSGPFATWFDATRNIKGDTVRIPREVIRHIVDLPGPAFQVPFECTCKVYDATRRDVAWISEKMGFDVASYDEPLEDSGLTLQSFSTFDDREVHDISAALDHINRMPLRIFTNNVRQTERRMRRQCERSMTSLTSVAATSGDLGD